MGYLEYLTGKKALEVGDYKKAIVCFENDDYEDDNYRSRECKLGYAYYLLSVKSGIDKISTALNYLTSVELIHNQEAAYYLGRLYDPLIDDMSKLPCDYTSVGNAIKYYFKCIRDYEKSTYDYLPQYAYHNLSNIFGKIIKDNFSAACFAKVALKYGYRDEISDSYDFYFEKNGQERKKIISTINDLDEIIEKTNSEDKLLKYAIDKHNNGFHKEAYNAFSVLEEEYNTENEEFSHCYAVSMYKYAKENGCLNKYADRIISELEKYNNDYSQFWLGYIYADLNRKSKAYEYYLKLIRNYKNEYKGIYSSSALNNLGLLYEDDGQKFVAACLFEQGIRDYADSDSVGHRNYKRVSTDFTDKDIQRICNMSREELVAYLYNHPIY